MLLNRIYRLALTGAALILTAGNASAHHLMGGRTPSTFMEGFLSGVGHPVIGPDHFAFLIAVGIAVGVGGLSFSNPFLFLLAMSCGVAAHVAGISVPAADPIVAISVLSVGMLLLSRRSGRSVNQGWWAAFFVVAGFFPWLCLWRVNVRRGVHSACRVPRWPRRGPKRADYWRCARVTRTVAFDVGTAPCWRSDWRGGLCRARGAIGPNALGGELKPLHGN